MILLKINSIKAFTSNLLVKETFDKYLLVEAFIRTHSDFSINGTLNKEYYCADDTNYNLKYNYWHEERDICYSIIKGNRLPTYFKFVFMLPADITDTIVSQTDTFKTNDVNGLFINIKYENGAITLTTGTSCNTFSLDKSLDTELDKYIKCFLQQNNIEYTIC